MICTLFIQVKHFSTLPGISPHLRKIALKLKLKKVIEQQGEQCVIKTSSTFRNYTISFRVGQEFKEFTKGLDNQHVKVKMTAQNCAFEVIMSIMTASFCRLSDVF